MSKDPRIPINADRHELDELVQEAEEIRDAVYGAIKTYLVEREGWSVSMVSELSSFFNGYYGAPNLDTFPDRLERALEDPSDIDPPQPTVIYDEVDVEKRKS